MKKLMQNNFKYGILASISIVIFSVFSSCSVLKLKSSKSEVEKLGKIMTGSFNSSSQAKKDSNYYDISLHMYPIWKKEEAYYLYVEQSVTVDQSKPYRQRVYKLEKVSKNKFKSSIYILENPNKFIGKWKDPSFFEQFDLDIIREKEGCEVYINKINSTFIGSTQEQHCRSSLRGATYATSKVEISKNKITSWDQGFDDEGKQVWGAENGPYIFVKY